MNTIIDQMHSQSATMTWVHAYAEWVETHAEYQEALIECREGRSFFPTDLSEAEYHAERAVILARQAVESQRAGRRVAAQVEALRTAPMQTLAEWAETPNGQKYMDLSGGAKDHRQEMAVKGHAAKQTLAGRHPGRTVQ